MKNWKPITVLVLFAVACGGSVQPAASAAMTEVPAQSVECSLTLPANSDPATIQSTVKAVINGSLDACQGSVSHINLYTATLERIDETTGADPVLLLVFRLRHLPPTQIP